MNQLHTGAIHGLCFQVDAAICCASSWLGRGRLRHTPQGQTHWRRCPRPWRAQLRERQPSSCAAGAQRTSSARARRILAALTHQALSSAALRPAYGSHGHCRLARWLRCSPVNQRAAGTHAACERNAAAHAHGLSWQDRTIHCTVSSRSMSGAPWLGCWRRLQGLPQQVQSVLQRGGAGGAWKAAVYACASP